MTETAFDAEDEFERLIRVRVEFQKQVEKVLEQAWRNSGGMEK